MGKKAEWPAEGSMSPIDKVPFPLALVWQLLSYFGGHTPLYVSLLIIQPSPFPCPSLFVSVSIVSFFSPISRFHRQNEREGSGTKTCFLYCL